MCTFPFLRGGGKITDIKSTHDNMMFLKNGVAILYGQAENIVNCSYVPYTYPDFPECPIVVVNQRVDNPNIENYDKFVGVIVGKSGFNVYTASSEKPISITYIAIGKWK